MKAELEEAMKEVGFKYTILVRPGMLVGDRSDSRPAQAVFRGVAKCLGGVSRKWLTDWWAQDVDIIGRAVVIAAIQCAESKREPGIWQIEQTRKDRRCSSQSCIHLTRRRIPEHVYVHTYADSLTR